MTKLFLFFLKCLENKAMAHCIYETAFLLGLLLLTDLMSQLSRRAHVNLFTYMPIILIEVAMTHHCTLLKIHTHLIFAVSFLLHVNFLSLPC